MKSMFLFKLLCILLFFVNPPDFIKKYSGVKGIEAKLSEGMFLEKNIALNKDNKIENNNTVDSTNVEIDKKPNDFQKINIINSFEKSDKLDKPLIEKLEIEESDNLTKKIAKTENKEDQEKEKNHSDKIDSQQEKQDFTDQIKKFTLLVIEKSQIYAVMTANLLDPFIQKYKIQIILYIILIALLILLARKILKSNTKLKKQFSNNEDSLNFKPKSSKNYYTPIVQEDEEGSDIEKSNEKKRISLLGRKNKKPNLEVDYVSLFKKTANKEAKKEQYIEDKKDTNSESNDKKPNQDYFQFYNSCFNKEKDNNSYLENTKLNARNVNDFNQDFFKYTEFVEEEKKYKSNFYSNNFTNSYKENENINIFKASKNEIIEDTGFNKIKIISYDISNEEKNTIIPISNKEVIKEEIDMFELFGKKDDEKTQKQVFKEKEDDKISTFCFSSTYNNVAFKDPEKNIEKEDKTVKLLENLNSKKIQETPKNSIEEFFDFFSEVNRVDEKASNDVTKLITSSTPISNKDAQIQQKQVDNNYTPTPMLQMQQESKENIKKVEEIDEEEYSKLSLVEKQKRDFENILKIPKKCSDNSTRSQPTQVNVNTGLSSSIEKEKKLKKEFQPPMGKIMEEKETEDEVKKDVELNDSNHGIENSSLTNSYEEKDLNGDELDDKILNKLKKLKGKKCMIKI